nr:TRAV2.4 [Sphenodon punctatus]
MASRAWPASLKTLLGLLFLCSEITGDSSHSSEVSVSLGGTAQIFCIHGISPTSGVFWYKQGHGTAPEVTLSTYSDGDEKGRLKMTVDKANKSTELIIREVEMVDLGVYYCAAREHLAILLSSICWNKTDCTPNLQKSEPSVYELESTNKSHPLSACLFTDYFPGNINVSATGSDLVGIESSVVVVEDQASYGAVLWQNANENLQCIANYDGEDIQAKKDIADSCSGTQMSFQTDERLNLLSLTVLGLRVIFFKSVAVNLLLTFRLWSR